MSSVPVPPPRKKKPSSASNDKFSNFYGNNGGFPSGRQTGDSDRRNDCGGILDETPDATIGDEVTISGDMQFDRLLRIDGRFEGKLLTEGGNLIIGPAGVLIGDVVNVDTMIVDGKVIGNISVDKLKLRNNAVVHGDIASKSVTMDPHVVLVGNLNIHGKSPGFIDTDGNDIEKPLNRGSSSRRSSKNVIEAEWESKNNSAVGSAANLAKSKAASKNPSALVTPAATTPSMSAAPSTTSAIFPDEKGQLSAVPSTASAGIAGAKPDPVPEPEKPALVETPFIQAIEENKENIEKIEKVEPAAVEEPVAVAE